MNLSNGLTYRRTFGDNLIVERTQEGHAHIDQMTQLPLCFRNSNRSFGLALSDKLQVDDLHELQDNNENN